MFFLDRYGDAVEADFYRFYGLDMLDVLRVKDGRRLMSLRKFRNLVDRLPSHSATTSARANDDEHVSQFLESMTPEQRKAWERTRRSKPTLEEYTPEAARLDRVVSAVNDLFRLVDSFISGGANKLPPIVVPETAADRWERRKSRESMDALIAEVQEAQQRAKDRAHKKT